jgi:hypothetical protein
VRVLCGCRVAHWASLGLFDVAVCYRVSILTSSFDRAYKSHGWVSATPTWSFIISTVLLGLALTLQLLLHFTFDLHTCSLKVMARCSPLVEATTNMTEVEDVGRVAGLAEVT